jgi:hypothetical protein
LSDLMIVVIFAYRQMINILAIFWREHVTFDEIIMMSVFY